MLKFLVLSAAATAMLSGCKSGSKADDQGAAGTAPPPVVIDAAPAAPSVDAAAAPAGDDPAAGLDPEEAARRAGKRTGLGAPDELPQVATEALAQAIIEGKVPWSRFVDPALGILELNGGAVCGAQVEKRIKATIAEMKKDQADEAILACSNDGLADGGGSAACLTPAAMEGDDGHGFRFVADAARGLRLAGLESYEAGTRSTDFYQEAFDAYLEEIAVAKPCK